jgi:hypothetical protein
MIDCDYDVFLQNYTMSDDRVTVCLMLADVRLIVNLPVSLARQIHCYVVESQLMVLQERCREVEQMLQEGMYISTFGTD